MRIVSIRYGFNPNSSSLGADVSGLLLGVALTFLLTASLTVWLRLAARMGRVEPHSDAETDA